jgi:hypothetical protein
MRKPARLPARFPAGTKYVLEAHGRTIHRYIEFADGSRIDLRPRQAVTCNCKSRRDLKLRTEAGQASHPKRVRVAA